MIRGNRNRNEGVPQSQLSQRSMSSPRSFFWHSSQGSCAKKTHDGSKHRTQRKKTAVGCIPPRYPHHHLWPLLKQTYGKNQSGSDYQTDKRLLFRIGQATPATARRVLMISSGSSFTSDSSSGSERGLDVAVRGLSAGLTLPLQSGLEALPPAHMHFCIFVWQQCCSRRGGRWVSGAGWLRDQHHTLDRDFER
jgi:hypothetical protein